ATVALYVIGRRHRRSPHPSWGGGGPIFTIVRRIAYYLGQYAVDVRHGMVTPDVVHDPLAWDADSEVRPHQPPPAPPLHPVLGSLPVEPPRYPFVGLGCGKGAALILAAKHGYGRLVGVELDGELIEVARRNVSALRRRRPTLADRIELVHRDAAEFAWPDAQ